MADLFSVAEIDTVGRALAGVSEERWAEMLPHVRTPWLSAAEVAMEHAGSILSARGGTMTAEALDRLVFRASEMRGGAADYFATLLSHTRAQGAALARAQQERDEALAEVEAWKAKCSALELERDAVQGTLTEALADNAAKDKAFGEYVSERGVEHDDIPGTETPCPEDDTCECPRIRALNAAFGLGHPGAALLERLAKAEREVERLECRLANKELDAQNEWVDRCRAAEERAEAAESQIAEARRDSLEDARRAEHAEFMRERAEAAHDALRAEVDRLKAEAAGARDAALAEAAARCRQMVVGGRAWTEKQAIAADALLAVAEAIAALRSAPSRQCPTDRDDVLEEAARVADAEVPHALIARDIATNIRALKSKLSGIPGELTMEDKVHVDSGRARPAVSVKVPAQVAPSVPVARVREVLKESLAYAEEGAEPGGAGWHGRIACVKEIAHDLGIDLTDKGDGVA